MEVRRQADPKINYREATEEANFPLTHPGASLAVKPHGNLRHIFNEEKMGDTFAFGGEKCCS